MVIVLSVVGIVSPWLHSSPNTPQTGWAEKKSEKKEIITEGWLYAGYIAACKNVIKFAFFHKQT